MQTELITLAEAKVLLAALPTSTHQSRAVQGWLASAIYWAARANPAAKLDVVITLYSDSYSRRLHLEVSSGCRYHIHLAQVFLHLEIPNPGQCIKRRTSIRRYDYINGKKHHNAVPQVLRNFETNLKYSQPVSGSSAAR